MVIAERTCNLSVASCSVPSRWGPLNIDLSPRPVPVLQPITFKLRFDNNAVANAWVDLNGVDMDMGPNRAKLQALDEKTLIGQITIPICLTGTMRWQLNLHLDEGRHSETIRLTFSAPLSHNKTDM